MWYAAKSTLQTALVPLHASHFLAWLNSMSTCLFLLPSECAGLNDCTCYSWGQLPLASGLCPVALCITCDFTALGQICAQHAP